MQKSTLHVETFEEYLAARDHDVRSRVLKIRNRPLDMFGTPEEYNDYLCETEDMIFNLVKCVDVEDMNARLDEYRKKHRDEISANESHKREFLERERERVQAERERLEKARRDAIRQDNEVNVDLDSIKAQQNAFEQEASLLRTALEFEADGTVRLPTVPLDLGLNLSQPRPLQETELKHSKPPPYRAYFSKAPLHTKRACLLAGGYHSDLQITRARIEAASAFG